MKRACYCFPYLNLWLLLTFIAAGTLYMQAQKWLPSDSLFAHYLQNKGYKIINNNQFTLLPSGREKLDHVSA